MKPVFPFGSSRSDMGPQDPICVQWRLMVGQIRSWHHIQFGYRLWPPSYKKGEILGNILNWSPLAECLDPSCDEALPPAECLDPLLYGFLHLCLDGWMAVICA